ncbi:MAG: hypothetical protein ACRDD1_10910, partial [Planctomycetia bacterium]
MLRRFSLYCSESAYRAIESFLLEFVEVEDRSIREDHHTRVLNGDLDRPNRRGLTQYRLLPALPAARKSDAAKNLEGIVRCKFSPHRSYFDLPPGWAGFVRSPIADKRRRPSDRAWLDLVGRKPAKPGRSGRRSGKDNCVESSPEQFANDLFVAARRQPDRFAQLALRFPADADPLYLNELLRALSFDEAPEKLDEPAREAWRPASFASLRKIVEAAAARRDERFAASLANLLRARSDEPWTEPTVTAVVNLALRSTEGISTSYTRRRPNDPGPPPVSDLEIRAFNCIRGQAALATAALLRSDPDRLSYLRDAIAAFVGDSDPAVRAAAIDVCAQVWRVDPDQAVAWFLSACTDGDDRIPATRFGQGFLRILFGSRPEAAEPVVRRMVVSELPVVAETGAEFAVALHLQYG